jgi:multiple sugar transport system ATP-binding protein
MSLELVNLRKEFGDILAVDDVSITADDDDFLVLVGPSGSGKTTVLRMIAGLETPTSGDISISGETVTNRTPANRNIAMVFQNYALYPHMTVEENMGLSLKVDGVDSSDVRQKVKGVAETLGIGELLDRSPSELSGGQQQRVAVGRAIVRDPSVFLMDEPLSNLDAKLRMEMRKKLEKLHQRLETTFVYVTHDQTEAMTMGTKIAVLDQGRLQQVGTPEELYDDPRNEFVAEFIGSPSMNLLPVSVVNEGGDVTLDAGPFSYPLNDRLGEKVRTADATSYTLGIRPEEIRIDEAGRFEAEVDVTEPTGAQIIAYLTCGDLEVLVETERDGTVREAQKVRFDIPEEHIHLFADRVAL